jgi:hypothetical protein
VSVLVDLFQDRLKQSATWIMKVTRSLNCSPLTPIWSVSRQRPVKLGSGGGMQRGG